MRSRPATPVVPQRITDPDLGGSDHLDHLDRLDPPARPAQLDRPGPRVHLDRPVCLGHPVRPDPPARLAPQVRPGLRVQGRLGQGPQARGDDAQRWTVRIRLTPLSEASLGPASRVAPEEERE